MDISLDLTQVLIAIITLLGGWITKEVSGYFAAKKEKIAVVGLGYVGLPLAIYFGRRYQVIGFDVNRQRIIELKDNYDKTGEATCEELLQACLDLTDSPQKLQEARLIIATVPGSKLIH